MAGSRTTKMHEHLQGGQTKVSTLAHKQFHQLISRCRIRIYDKVLSSFVYKRNLMTLLLRFDLRQESGYQSRATIGMCQFLDKRHMTFQKAADVATEL